MNLYDDIILECELPDFLKRDLDAFSIFPKSAIAIKTWSTLIHLYDALNGTIQSGRYNLVLSSKPIYEDAFKIYDEDDEILRCTYLNSALMHYNCSFDIYLECVWVGLGLYRYVKNEGQLSLNTNKEYEKILSLCTYKIIKTLEDKIDDSLFEDIKTLRKKQKKIAGWTNNLKHRGNLVYADFFEENIVAKTISKEENTVFDSSKSQSQVTIDKVVGSLIEYHKTLILVTRHLDIYYRNRIIQTAIKSTI